jgi:hypothetical protein
MLKKPYVECLRSNESYEILTKLFSEASGIMKLKMRKTRVSFTSDNGRGIKSGFIPSDTEFKGRFRGRYFTFHPAEGTGEKHKILNMPRQCEV